MKIERFFIYAIYILLAVTLVSAGHLNVSSPEFEDGSHDYDGPAEIDADTLDGMTKEDIEDEFDDLQDTVDEMQDDIEHNEDEIYDNYQENLRQNVIINHNFHDIDDLEDVTDDLQDQINDNEDSINDIEDDIDDINDDLDTHQDIISDNSQAIINNWVDNQVQNSRLDSHEDEIADNDDNITSINQYISSKEESWSKDIVGGGGLSTSGLSYKLVGHSSIFNAFDTFIDYLTSMFVLRSEYDKVLERLDRLETVVGILMEKTDTKVEDLDMVVALTKAKRDGYGEYKDYGCTDDGVCIKTVS